MQPGVGGGAAIGRYNINRLGRADLLINLPDEVKQLRRHRGDLIGAEVAQEIIELGEALRVIDAVVLEGNAGRLAGMGMVEIKRAVASLGADLKGRRRQ